ncbi:MAG: M23 family metallopeptidase [Chlorobiaceae bacterium]|nr:M23 family metallopeptidase [Chlorobiaceae bacterium]NTV16319.1 M23 family metallopeptidase [Chlorobiaceae bacterium]
MIAPKKIFQMFFSRLRPLKQKISPAHLLPLLAGTLVVVFFTITLLLSDPGSYTDELGFTGDNDVVVIEESPPVKQPLVTVTREKIKPGESLYTILSDKGLSPNEIDGITKQLKGNFSLRGFRPGQSYETAKNSDGTLHHFSYFQDKATTIHIEQNEETSQLVVRRDVKEFDTRIASLEGTVTNNLSSSLKSNGRPNLMGGIKNLFSSRVNFRNDINPGTKYKILFEEKWLMNEFISTGKILAVELSLANRTCKAYLYTDNKGKSGYFDEHGNALERTSLFITPCNYSHISSSFGYRIHPLKRTRHFHGGIDLAAASGTPVRAVADGRIIFKGTKGGAGNMITVAHSDHYYSQYLHLSRYAMRSGNSTKINQGQIIGYVGSTGSSTGPHLDFRIIHNGKPMNPIAALGSSTSRTISHAERGNFFASISAMKAQLDNNRMLVASSSANRSGNRRNLVAI